MSSKPRSHPMIAYIQETAKHKLVRLGIKKSDQTNHLSTTNLKYFSFPLLLKKTAFWLFNLHKCLKVSIFLKLSWKGFIILCTYTSTFCCESQYLLHFFSASLNGTCVWLLNKHECIEFCNTSSTVICWDFFHSSNSKQIYFSNKIL